MTSHTPVTGVLTTELLGDLWRARFIFVTLDKLNGQLSAGCLAACLLTAACMFLQFGGLSVLFQKIFFGGGGGGEGMSCSSAYISIMHLASKS